MVAKECEIILMADDDEDDRLLVKQAMEENGVTIPLAFVDDGVELMDYLNGRGKYASQPDRPAPCLILLDLNMPKKDGRETLKEIKMNAALRRIPTVVLTTSSAEEDVQRSYNNGANSFITKPITFKDLVQVMRKVKEYWLEAVSLPS